MSEKGEVSIEAVLGNRENGVKVEPSWSEGLATGAEGQGVPEFRRTPEVFQNAVNRTRQSRVDSIQSTGNRLLLGSTPAPSKFHHFFVLKGKKLEFIGSKEMDASKFQKDVSGRFYREWLKTAFPGRKDYEDIVSFDDKMTMKEIAELLGL